jgi:hypothetical protein
MLPRSSDPTAKPMLSVFIGPSFPLHLLHFSALLLPTIRWREKEYQRREQIRRSAPFAASAAINTPSFFMIMPRPLTILA